MPLSIDLINQLKIDIQYGQDSTNFDFNEEELDLFWDWFQINAVSFNQSNSIDASLVSSTENLPSRCFGNSQRKTVNNSLQYAEGFVKVHGAFIHHGFNIVNNQYIDYTVLSYPDAFRCHDRLPYKYYGIIINTELINDNADEINALIGYNDPKLELVFRQSQ